MLTNCTVCRWLPSTNVWPHFFCEDLLHYHKFTTSLWSRGGSGVVEYGVRYAVLVAVNVVWEDWRAGQPIVRVSRPKIIKVSVVAAGLVR